MTILQRVSLETWIVSSNKQRTQNSCCEEMQWATRKLKELNLRNNNDEQNKYFIKDIAIIKRDQTNAIPNEFKNEVNNA